MNRTLTRGDICEDRDVLLNSQLSTELVHRRADEGKFLMALTVETVIALPCDAELEEMADLIEDEPIILMLVNCQQRDAGFCDTS